MFLLLASGAITIIYTSTTQKAFADSFNTPINLSNNNPYILANTAEDSHVAISGSNVYVVWWSQPPNGNSDILFIKSTDGGKTFSSPVSLSNGLQGLSSLARIAASGSNVYVTFNDYTRYGTAYIAFTKSTDGGNTFSTPIIIANIHSTNTYQIQSDISASGSSNVYVAIQDFGTGPNHQYSDILFTKSTDGGNTFSTPIDLSNTIQQSLYAVLPTVSTSGNNIYVTWFTTPQLTTLSGQVYYTRSIDAGSTFSSPVAVSQSTAATMPHVAASANNVFITWVQGVYNAASAQLIKSIDAGSTFSNPVTLSSSINTHDADVATSGNTVAVVFIGDATHQGIPVKALFFTRSTDAGSTFSSPIDLTNSLPSPLPVLDALSISVSLDTNNNVYLAWPVQDGGIQDVYFMSGTIGCTSAQLIQALINYVNSQNLPTAVKNNLISLLNQAEAVIASNPNYNNLNTLLNTFISQVNYYLSQGQISQSLAAQLISQAQAIVTALHC
jgi:hypothetical protein